MLNYLNKITATLYGKSVAPSSFEVFNTVNHLITYCAPNGSWLINYVVDSGGKAHLGLHCSTPSGVERIYTFNKIKKGFIKVTLNSKTTFTVRPTGFIKFLSNTLKAAPKGYLS